jgi:hypothetical protein
MPSDESVEQHDKKRLEEIAEVEKDRDGPDGLFKGTFPPNRAKLWRDEADGVMRCPECGHEHEGGQSCHNCGIELEVDDFFSDIDDDDFDLDGLEGLEGDLDIEVDAEFGMQGHPYFQDIGDHRRAFVQHYHHHHHPRLARDVITDTSDGSEIDSDEEEDQDSIHDFVVPDDEEPTRGSGRDPINRASVQQPITISDDESDEGGAVSNRRPRRRAWQAGNSTPSAPSVLTVTDTSVNGSETGDEAEMLRHAGWSPLDQGNDSDTEGPVQYGGYNTGYGVTEDERDSDDVSDTNTETMDGNGFTDEEDEDRLRNHPSLTPTNAYPHRNGFTDDEDDDRLRNHPSLTPTDGYPHPSDPHYTRYNPYNNISDEQFDNDADDDDSELESVAMDRDGDTEMSASPRASRSSRSVSITTAHTNPYARDRDSDPRSSRSVSMSTNHNYSRASGFSTGGRRGESVDNNDIGYGLGANLGVANEIHEVEDEISDSSIRPPPRRLPRRYHPNTRTQQYDPRISMIFAEHQQSLRGTQHNPIGLDEWDGEVRRVEPASRNRRMTAYRMMPLRRVDPLRSSRSPSATRIISPADRSSRIPRQYVRRN